MSLIKLNKSSSNIKYISLLNINLLMQSLLFIFIISGLLYSQPITWNEITSQHPALPEGVKLFKGERSFPALQVWYLEVDMKKEGVAVRPYYSTAPGGKEGLVPFIQRFNSVAGINGGYFDLNSAASYSALVYPNNVVSKNIASVVRDGQTYFLTRSFFGITDAREMSFDWIYHFGNNVSNIYKFENPINNQQGTPGLLPSPNNGTSYLELLTGIGGGPMLIKNSQLNITYTEEVFWGSGVGLSNRDPRTAVGFTSDQKIILLTADGRQTLSEGLSLTELANLMIELGCIEAMNLDGGGSTQMAVGNNLINKPEGGTFQRPVPTILAVVTGDSIPYLPPVFFNNKFDTNDPECNLTGNWSNSTIPGYWGTTLSQRAPIGNGDSYATFKPNLPKEGEYEVFAWWVSAVDRSTETPFIINHKNGISTVRVNQQINGSRWNSLGKFIFNGNENDSISVSNDATTGSYVIADGLRILSYDSSIVSNIKFSEGSIGEENNSADNFLLKQNFPNPFNPVTEIGYQISEDRNVSLTIYDLLGNEIATLVNGFKNAGNHNVKFNAGELAGGIYFYRIIASNGVNSFSQSKKMVVLK